MFYDLAGLIAGILVTFTASFLLTNLVEHIQSKTSLGRSFVGSIVAPLFTSFPELVVFLTSILAVQGEKGHEIGIGTLFGQPFMTATISYGLVGIAVALGFITHNRKYTTMNVDKNLAIPYVFISTLFPLLLLPGIINSISLQYTLGCIFLASYFLFVFTMYKKRTHLEESTYSSLIFRKALPSEVALLVQIIAIIVGLYVGSTYMVNSLVSLSASLGINALGLSILIVPVATSIPETLSSMIWAFRGEDSLSISSLVGEKVLYSTFYPAIGLFSIQWINNQYSDMSIIFTTIVSIIFLVYVRMQKLPIYILYSGIIFFSIFAIYIFNL